MRVLVDTNILGRYSQPEHPQNEAAIRAIETLGQAGHELRLVPQVAYEFWVVATRPTAQNGLGFTAAETYEAIHAFLDLFPLLRDERGVFEPWLHLVHSVPCLGKVAHDARLVAAMRRHGLSHILTYNTADFRRYADISLLHPEAVSGSSPNV